MRKVEVIRLIRWGLLCSQLFVFAHAAAPDSKYFDIPAWPGSQESCPSPRDIKNRVGIFTSPAKSDGAEWVGVLVDGAMESVTNFKKGLFVLTHEGVDSSGFLSSCIYATSGGRYLNMRLDLGENYKQVMWVGRSLSWRESRGFSSPAILECTDKITAACSFFLR
ncbi:DUF3757 domain-containing protein [Pseudomonas allokribbensis]|uniref:DUF3757 domain-containing protein n=1 Tax=Pseudomonas allokribbensis TaxID=2774460 RepID=UPI003CC672A3